MRRSGFTLVEMLGATALTALLMAAAMAVVGTLGRTQRALDAAAARADESAGVIALLRFDLANARDVRFGGGTLTIRGVGGLSRGDAQPTQRPVEVVYDVAEIAGRRWLVRSQREADVLSNERPSRRLLREDVASFSVEPLGLERRQIAEPTEFDLPPDPTLPPRVRVTLATTDGAPPVREVIVVR